jgi:hypothetical protein
MGLAAVGVLMIAAAVFLGCRIVQVHAAVPVLLVISLLAAAGAVNLSAQ